MNLDTPLVEVAQHLPQEAAELLMYVPVQRQNAVLMAVRRVMTDWEQRGVVLDAFSVNVVLTSFVQEILAVVLAALEHLQDAGYIDPIYREPR